jgi:ankyrin repeat protein
MRPERFDYKDVFRDNDAEALIRAVKNGLDVYLRESGKEIGIHNKGITFYEGAIRFGTPETVNAAIDAGACLNYADPTKAIRTNLPAQESSLYAAIAAKNVPVLRALLGKGADVRALRGLKWDFRRNAFPEGSSGRDMDEKTAHFMRELRSGAEILRILRDAGAPVPGTRCEGAEMSLFKAWGREAWFSPNLGDDRALCHCGTGGSCKVMEHERFTARADDYADYDEIYDDINQKGDPEYHFPIQGNRPNAPWLAASPGALKFMIDAGADVNMTDSAGWTAMHHIAEMGEYFYFEPAAMLKLLIDSGADINARGRYRMTPLMTAARRVRMQKRSIEMVKILLRNGADFDAQDERGQDVLFWTSDFWYDYLDLYDCEMLVEMIQEIHRSTKRPRRGGSARAANVDLMAAALWGKPEDLTPILSRGANVNAASRNRYTPLMFASVYNDSKAVAFLLENGADIDARNSSGETALMLTIQTRRDQMWDEMVETLVKMGSSVNNADKFGRTPLMLCIGHGLGTRMLRILIDAGADVNARDQEGQTPLMYAVAQHSVYLETVAVLIDAGADVNAADDSGETVLETLLSNDHYSFGPSCNVPDTFNLLINSGADIRPMQNKVMNKEVKPDKRDGRSNRILKTLAKFGLNPCDNFKDLFACNDAQALTRAVENGLDPDIEDSLYGTFFQSAVKYGTYDLVRACADSGIDVNAGYGNGHPDYMWPVLLSIEGHNPSTLRALIEAGAKLEDVSCLSWRMRDNVFPEGGEGGDSARKFKARLDAGAEVLKILEKAGIPIAERASSGTELTYVGVDYRSKRLREERYSPEISEAFEPDADPDEKNDACSCDDPLTVSKLRRAVSRHALAPLINSGAGVNARGDCEETVLHCIADNYERGYFNPDAMIELLIDAGADAGAPDEQGVTPLMLIAGNIASNIHALSAMMILASHGVNFEAVDKEGRSAADWAERSFEHKHLGYNDEYCEKLLLRDLIGEIGNRDARRSAADVELMAVSCYGGADEIIAALSSGANVNSASKTGFTPLMFAVVFNENIEAVKTLLSAGADANARTAHGQTPLMAVSRISNSENARKIVPLLLDAGADMEAEDNDGNTALKLSMDNSRLIKTTKILLAAGANPRSVIAGRVSANAGDDESADCGELGAADVLRGFGLIVRGSGNSC